jgi:predicted membrane channel-forming protein YqfA (hemolysin III family)
VKSEKLFTLHTSALKMVLQETQKDKIAFLLFLILVLLCFLVSALGQDLKKIKKIITIWSRVIFVK